MLTFLVADLDPASRPSRTGPVPAQLARALEAAEGATRIESRSGLAAAFTDADAALRAAVAIREVAVDQVRVALHTGAEGADGRFAGEALRRAQRLREIAGGGQILVTALTASLCSVELVDRGIHRLRDLSRPERVFSVGAGAPLRSLDAGRHNLPVQASSFVGRIDELVELHRLLAFERLVTLLGPGGAGKTRLATHALAEQVGRWPDGVWWVDLSGVTSGVADAVAAAVGVLVEPVQGPLASLARGLRERRTLIGFDNCEQVLAEAAEVVSVLLEECPEVSVLATSREALGVAGEVVWSVPALGVDDGLWLFLERGGGAADEAVFRSLIQRLDGMPLALELAAAWLRTMPADEIEAGLEDRFELLVRGARGVSERQRTLEASIAWSHDLLSEDERGVFRRLGVFPGSFDVDAARALGAWPALGRLVEQSLVAFDGERYRLLESIRAYASARLEEAGEGDSLRSLHVDHFLAFVEEAEPLLESDKDAWRLRMEREGDNLRAALEFGLGLDDERGRRLAAGLPWLWHLNRHGVIGLELLQRALVDDDRSLLQGRLLVGISLVADTTAPHILEFDAAQRALEIANEHGDERLKALALGLAAVGRFYNEPDAAWALADRSIEAAAASGERFIAAASPGLQGIILHLRDRHAEAEERFTPAVEDLLALGVRGVASSLLTFQGIGALVTGEADRALLLAERAVEVADPLQDYHRVGMARSALAFVRGSRGEDIGDELADFVALERSVFVPGLARVLGYVALWRGALDEALSWLEAEATPAGTYADAQALPPLAATLRRLGRAEEARVVADRAVALALSLRMPWVHALALDELAWLGSLDEALELHHEALGVRVEHGLRWGFPPSLEALARLAFDGGQPDHAARLLAAAARGRSELGYPLPPVERSDLPAVELGEPMQLDEAVGYARRSRGTRDRPLSGWASLTPAERDVVKLAIEGLNNPQIGERLYMSRHTVKTHLSHVYTKLGVSSRTELATAAVNR